MTYFGFLAKFVVIPLALVGGLTLYDVACRKKTLPTRLSGLPTWIAQLAWALPPIIFQLAFGADNLFWRGNGWEIVIQGGFLFFFDLLHVLGIPRPENVGKIPSL